MRSEARKLNAANGKVHDDSRALKAELNSMRAQLEKEKRDDLKLKTDASKGKDGMSALRAEINALRSELEREKHDNSELRDQLVSLRADLDLMRYDFEGGVGGDKSITPETRRDLEKILNMNDMLRRVIQGERIHREEMHGKLHSLRSKVGPLMAKVDTLQGTVDQIQAHFSVHDAPIELIMDFVGNFYQWWEKRYNARNGVNGSEDNDGTQAASV